MRTYVGFFEAGSQIVLASQWVVKLGFPLSCSRIESYSYVEFFLQVLARVTIGFLDISFLLYVLYNCMYAVVLFTLTLPGAKRQLPRITSLWLLVWQTLETAVGGFFCGFYVSPNLQRKWFSIYFIIFRHWKKLINIPLSYNDIIVFFVTLN